MIKTILNWLQNKIKYDLLNVISNIKYLIKYYEKNKEREYHKYYIFSFNKQATDRKFLCQLACDKEYLEDMIAELSMHTHANKLDFHKDLASKVIDMLSFCKQCNSNLLSQICSIYPNYLYVGRRSTVVFEREKRVLGSTATRTTRISSRNKSSSTKIFLAHND